MKEILIFLVIFLVIFSVTLVIFNGRFIYVQLKYHFIGPPPIEQRMVSKEQRIINNEHETRLDLFDRLVIPNIGVDAPIVLTETINEHIIHKALEKGVVNYPDSNIILGHSSAYPWYRGNYGSVFSLLNKLEKGDEILIFSQKKKYTYQVSEKQIAKPKDLNIEKKEKSVLYLVSCWPINTNWKRIAIKAERVDK